MQERELVKEAVHIAAMGILLYWLIFTKSGRLCFFLVLGIGIFRSEFYPDVDADEPPTSSIAQCKRDARTTWGPETAHLKLQACYDRYVPTYDWSK